MMRTFEHFSAEGLRPCPICGTSDDKETMLIGICGTQRGCNIEATQVHTECLQEGLIYDKDLNLIYTTADK